MLEDKKREEGKVGGAHPGIENCTRTTDVLLPSEWFKMRQALCKWWFLSGGLMPGQERTQEHSPQRQE